MNNVLKELKVIKKFCSARMFVHEFRATAWSGWAMKCYSHLCCCLPVASCSGSLLAVILKPSFYFIFPSVLDSRIRNRVMCLVLQSSWNKPDDLFYETWRPFFTWLLFLTVLICRCWLEMCVNCLLLAFGSRFEYSAVCWFGKSHRPLFTNLFCCPWIASYILRSLCLVSVASFVGCDCNQDNQTALQVHNKSEMKRPFRVYG
jgi:hypothetical protein